MQLQAIKFGECLNYKKITLSFYIKVDITLVNIYLENNLFRLFKSFS